MKHPNGGVPFFLNIDSKNRSVGTLFWCFVFFFFFCCVSP